MKPPVIGRQDDGPGRRRAFHAGDFNQVIYPERREPDARKNAEVIVRENLQETQARLWKGRQRQYGWRGACHEADLRGRVAQVTKGSHDAMERDRLRERLSFFPLASRAPAGPPAP